jgi:hypothetical protein
MRVTPGKKTAEPLRTPPFLLEHFYGRTKVIHPATASERPSAGPGRARNNELARIPLRPPGQHEVRTNDEPRHQPARPEAQPNQRLYEPLGSPPSVAVGLSSARAAHRSRAPQSDIQRMTQIASGEKISSADCSARARRSATSRISAYCQEVTMPSGAGSTIAVRLQSRCASTRVRAPSLRCGGGITSSSCHCHSIVVYNLNDLMRADDPWRLSAQLQHAAVINNRGQILALGAGNTNYLLAPSGQPDRPVHSSLRVQKTANHCTGRI